MLAVSLHRCNGVAHGIRVHCDPHSERARLPLYAEQMPLFCKGTA